MNRRGDRDRENNFFHDEDEEEDEEEEDEEESEEDDEIFDEDDEDDDFDDDDFEEEEFDIDEVIAINEGLIEEFEDYLKSKRFPGSQRSSLVRCVELFSDDYLVDFAVGSLDGISKEEVIDEFLGDYFIRQSCHGKDDLRRMVHALRSFYHFVAECYGSEEEGRNARDILKYLDREERDLYRRLRRWEDGFGEDF